MKFIDLFAGIGGFRYGLESVGEHLQEQGTSRNDLRQGGVKSKPNASQTRGESGHAYHCVWSNEWDKYAAQIYKKHYGEINTDDIRTVKPSSIPKHDLITAGFPCQSFSIAGKRKGFGDTRGTLFYEICRIARFHRTPYLLLENVKGLLNHDKGQTFSVILESLDELGYDCQWQVLNSKDFGVPQNRERVFIVGHLRGTPRPKVFPIRESNQAVTKVRATDSQENGRDSKSENGWPTKRRKIYIPSSKNQDGKRAKRRNLCVRRLTPTECERLQGFPDGWTEGISDTQRYKCLGNAVTTNVITAIGERLAKIELLK